MKRIATTLLVAGLIVTPMLALPPHATAGVSVGISIGIAPPVLPVYAQPLAPGPGYLWTPGYWAWDPGYGDYYWVPGAWVMPPQVGLLWTPGWWGWSAGRYHWTPGYWGPRVGFYGGVNYGHGYSGSGYSGGYWRGNNFFYNRAVNNVNVTNIRNVYVNKTVVNNVSRVSYNGGRGGLTARPNATQRAATRERRWSPTALQTQQRDTAQRNPAQRFTANRGRPAVFATQRAGRLDDTRDVRAPGRPQPEAAQAHREVAAPQRARGMVEAPRERTTQERSAAQPLRAPQAQREHVPSNRGDADTSRREPAARGRGATESREAHRAPPTHRAPPSKSGHRTAKPKSSGDERE